MLANRSARALAVGVVTVAIGVAAYLTGSAQADDGATSDAPTTGVTVLGTGTVSGTPDVLRVSLRVGATRSSVEDALSAASRTMRAVRSSLASAGVADRDLKTSGLSVRPDYDYTREGRVLRGYRAAESMTARLRDIDTAGRIIGSAVEAGGNSIRVEGIDLDLSSDSALTKSARDEAFADAKAKAEQYAAAAGRSLGAVRLISEDLQQSPAPFGGLSGRDSALAGGTVATAPNVPIEPGTQRVSVNVVASWELD